MIHSLACAFLAASTTDRAPASGAIDLTPPGGDDSVHLKGENLTWRATFYPDPDQNTTPFTYFETQAGVQAPSWSYGGYYVDDGSYYWARVDSPEGGNLSETVTVEVDGNWTSGGQYMSDSDTVSITSIVPRVTSVSFIDNGGNAVALTRYPEDTPIEDPEWVQELDETEPSKDEAAAYVGGTAFPPDNESFARVTLTIDATEDPTTPTWIKVRGVQVDATDENFHPKDVEVTSWPVTVTLDSSPLYVYVNHYLDLEVQWQYKANSSTWVDMNVTSHKVYITHAQPRPETVVYNLALYYATGYAANETNVNAICTELASGISDDITYDPKDGILCLPFAAYVVHAGGVQCEVHADLMKVLTDSLMGHLASRRRFRGGSSFLSANHFNHGVHSGSLQFDLPVEDLAPADPLYSFHEVVYVQSTGYFDPTYGSAGMPEVIRLAAPGVDYYRLPHLTYIGPDSPSCSVRWGPWWYSPFLKRWHDGSVAVSIFP